MVVHLVRIGRGFSLQVIGFLESDGGPGVTNSNLFFSTDYLADIIEFNPAPLYKDKSFLHQKYVLEGRSIGQIADEIFSSKEAVRTSLVRFGIPVREAHRPHSNPSHTRYGEKKQNGKVVQHLAEARVVQAARDMASQGMSLRQIAKFLGQIGVPTKQRGKAWHPEMVRRILSGAASANFTATTTELKNDNRAPVS